jgi:hypothetical protein
MWYLDKRKMRQKNALRHTVTKRKKYVSSSRGKPVKYDVPRGPELFNQEKKSQWQTGSAVLAHLIPFQKAVTFPSTQAKGKIISLITNSISLRIKILTILHFV